MANDDVQPLLDLMFDEATETAVPDPETPSNDVDAQTGAEVTAQTFDAEAAGEKIAEKTVVLELHVRRPGLHKALRPETFIHGADTEVAQTDETWVRVSQDLIDKKDPALKAINTCDSAFWTWLNNRRIPSKMLAPSLWLMPLSLANDVDQAVEDYRAQRSVLIEALGERWSALIEDARTRRGPYFQDADYPAFSQVRDRFQIEARFLTLNVPASLEGINKALWERENAKMKLKMADAAVEIQTALRAGFLSLVSAFKDRLGNDPETGKPRVFLPTSVNALNQFLDVFQHRNLTNDEELASLVTQTKALVAGVDPALVRTDSAFRASLESGFNTIAANAANLIQVQERIIELEDEDEPEAVPAEAAAA